MESNRSLSEFLKEIKWPITAAALKTIVYLSIALPLLVILFRWVQCKGWWGYEDPVKSHACGDMAQPFFYWIRVMGDLPKLFVGLPPIILGVLYLEWRKYKKDKPSGFGVYLGWTVPSGGWMRSNFERLVSGETWEKFDGFKLDRISESENRLCGMFSEEKVTKAVKSVSRRFTSFLRKPTFETADCTEWHIYANSGEELKLKLERMPQAMSPEWVLTASLFEWVGRNQPVRLVRTHATHFLVSSNTASAPEDTDSAAGGLN